MKTKTISYDHKGCELEAFLAVNEDGNQKKPTVFIIHDWSGRNEFACQRAVQIATMGYCGIAIDMYGKGKIGQTNAEKTALMQPVVNDRAFLRERLLAALAMAQSEAVVDQNKLGAMGFCFGGLCALDFARTGAPLKGIISFHGFLTAPPEENPAKINAKILVLQGADDPMARMDDTQAFAAEMTEKNVDWQIHVFGHTSHAFTNPVANDTKLGLIYNELAEKRSYRMMEQFWNEVF